MVTIDLGSDLLNYLVQQDLDPGERLPSITQLQDDQHLGISTSKVREQLEVARVLGFVEVRSKTGTRLKDYSFTPAVTLSLLYLLAREPHMFEMFSALRNHIESAFWVEACELLTEEDKETMQACVRQARDKLNGQWIRIPNEEHRTFHLTVFKRLNNPFVIGLLEAYWNAYDAVRLNTFADYDYLQTVWNYHERIIDAICAGEYEAARATFIEHTRLLRHQPRMRDMQERKGESIDDRLFTDGSSAENTP